MKFFPVRKDKRSTALPGTKLLDIKGGARRPDGTADLQIEVRFPDGTKREIAFTYSPHDSHGVAPQVRDWLKAHPSTKFGVLPPLTVGADDVKSEAARRIRQVIPTWQIEREATGGKPIPAPAKRAAQAIRDASNRLERLEPIPADYTADRYWPS
jgi:hypothetical protein